MPRSVANNRIEAIDSDDFKDLRSLKELDLSNNAITLSDQDNLGLTFLEKLNLARNNIKYLNCSGLPAILKSMKLAGNNWAGIINGMPTMKNLKLDVSDNPIILNSFLRDLYDRVGPFLTGMLLVNDLTCRFLSSCSYANVCQEFIMMHNTRIIIGALQELEMFTECVVIIEKLNIRIKLG
ncbi:uncharacterized protein TRIADDRAFT_60109 [Trichoplax adhaerens]|uniref:Uncharacterized protein n=1 Tax=Trichoplax adhaerens TaxID=10228 RepID=B3S7B8_TRIAD|nr:predicted protein [Trichoplax adhaerens]EDV21539.1 predicted protein [Trichoplax adhaerens]|eukprot:XP_002116139.1 predicted protein [Trichoplax adhaerens]